MHAGEGLAPIKGLAISVEVAMVVLGELAVGPHLAGEETAGERHADEDTNVPLLGQGEELLGGLLAENIEDDLNGLHVRTVECQPRFLDGLDAHPVVLDLAGPHEPVQGVECLVSVIDLGRRAVELQQVEGIYAEVFEAPLDKSGEVFVVITLGRMRNEAASGFSSDEDLIILALL